MVTKLWAPGGVSLFEFRVWDLEFMLTLFDAGNGGVTDFEKFGRPELIHLAFLALDDYRKVFSI